MLFGTGMSCRFLIMSCVDICLMLLSSARDLKIKTQKGEADVGAKASSYSFYVSCCRTCPRHILIRDIGGEPLRISVEYQAFVGGSSGIVLKYNHVVWVETILLLGMWLDRSIYCST